MSAAIERHEGSIEKFIGDAVMAVFGIPRVREDDALRAVRAAREMQDGLLRLNDELERAYGVRLANRIGVNTGEVIAGGPISGQRMLIGDPCERRRAARAVSRRDGGADRRAHLPARPRPRARRAGRAARAEGQGGADSRLPPTGGAQPAGLEPSGSGAVSSDARRRPRRSKAALDRAVTARSCELVVVTGEAGVGKSTAPARAHPPGLAEGARDPRTLSCPTAPESPSGRSWRRFARRRASPRRTTSPRPSRSCSKPSISDAKVAERIGSAIGLSDRQYPLHEIYWGARKLVEILAAETSARARARGSPLGRAGPVRPRRRRRRERLGRARPRHRHGTAGAAREARGLGARTPGSPWAR